MAASGTVVHGTVVHGWCGYVEKSNEVVAQQMVLNKLWIPDVLIDIIKDYLYISAAEVLRKFYRFNLNRSITDLTTISSYMIDIYGRQRLAHWAIGHVYGVGDVQIQGVVCVTCGNPMEHHHNINGCCALVLDEIDEPLYLVDDDSEPETETIPEVTWDIDIPVQHFVYADAEQAQFVLNALQQAREEQIEEHEDEYDIEAQMADYAEYQRELEMEEYEGRRTR
jgi:hypothetical protein